MSFIHWRSGGRMAIALTGLLAFLASCGPARYAYFQPQNRAIYRTASTAEALTAPADTVPSQTTLSTLHIDTAAAETNLTEVVQTNKPAIPERVSIERLDRHRNPDSYQNQRFRHLLGSVPAEHVAPKSQLIDRHSSSRKTHWMALVALGLAAVSYVPLLLVSAGTMAWVLTLMLPLSAMLMGAASLAAINRRKDRYRGKGWAMAAIVLGTGVLGMALLAVAALSVSELVHK